MIALRTSISILTLLLIILARAPLTEHFEVITHEAAASTPQNLEPARETPWSLSVVGFMPAHFAIGRQSVILDTGSCSKIELTTKLDVAFPQSSNPRYRLEHKSENSLINPRNKVARGEDGNPAGIDRPKRTGDEAIVNFGEPDKRNGFIVLEADSSTCLICARTFESPVVEYGKWKWKLLYKCCQCDQCYHISCLELWFASSRTCPHCRQKVDTAPPTLRQNKNPSTSRFVPFRRENI